MFDLQQEEMKYFRYRTHHGEWLYAYIDSDVHNKISFSKNYFDADKLSLYEIKIAFGSMKMDSRGVMPEQMTEIEFSVVCIMES